MPDQRRSRGRWYDAADARAWPAGVVAFALVAGACLAAGLGWWSLVNGFAFGCAAFNIVASRIRLRERRRGGG